jgi:protein-L-isoaspartate(D-aspartate) O-methyltransferase
MSSDPNAQRPRRFPATLSHLAPSAQSRQARHAAAPPPAGRPAGVGLDSAAVRARMVQRLRAQGCSDDTVLQALEQVPRHLFVDTALATQAYEDTSLPIGLGQTISKPSVVARMLELLRAGRGGAPFRQVLEIGTGCGYQAAVLSLLARQVFSIERLRPLHDKARDNLAPIRPAHLRLIYGDGRLGHPPNAPYDAIISAAGAAAVPEAWVDQLAPGGRLVAPALDATGATQVLVVIDRLEDGRIVRSLHESVRFVPLESGVD